MLTEACFAEDWCAEVAPFAAAGKPILAIEYTDRLETLAAFCALAVVQGAGVILKRRELDAYREECR